MNMDDILYELVKGFQSLRENEFFEKFEEDVDDLTVSVVSVHVLTDINTPWTVYVLANGFAVRAANTGYWSLYETRAHAEERNYLKSWNGFIRGQWSDRTPTQPGWYMVRDAELGRRSFRELIRKEGRLLDVSGGFVPAGKVSTWQGSWWSIPVPSTPGSY